MRQLSQHWKGILKIQGTAAVGEKLSADLKEVKPEGLSEDGISYIWSRKASADTENKNLKEISKEKTYTLTQEDLGSKIVLVITGLEDKGFSGTLKAETGEVTRGTIRYFIPGKRNCRYSDRGYRSSASGNAGTVSGDGRGS